MSRRFFCLLALTITLRQTLHAQAAPPAPEQTEFFEKRIRPVLIDTCGACHGAKKQKANLRLDSRAALLKGGDSGPAVVPGSPAQSLMIKAVGYTNDALRMPPKGKLTEETIADLAAWVRMGAPWPENVATTTGASTTSGFNLKERMNHWCWQPLRRPPVPEVKNRGWVHSPIDPFILARLEAKGLAPAPPAERRALLRRVTFDLIGLPPTPAELEAFLADCAADAFAKVVDRLLASPHYGERWARHWLDLARYAETYGHELDFEIPGASGYRDYVIRAFNADLPYDQFVTEQIAGDLLPEPRRHPSSGSNESIQGTGFWFLGEATHSPVDVRADEANHIDNQIDVFGKTFLGLTLACARCHDHKFDAISTRDYYALAGYLRSSRMQRAYLNSPGSSRFCAVHDQCVKGAVAWTARNLTDQLDKKLQDLERRLTSPHPPVPPKGSPIVFEDFRKPTYEGWYVTGDAFGNGPGKIGDFILHSTDQAPIQHILDAPAAHSGLVSTVLQGALRSRSFVISKKKICYHAAGRGCRINVIVDNYQLIREPIYGCLTVNVDSGESPKWIVQDVSMWIGERAYIEILDDGPGCIAVDRIVFADLGPPDDLPGPILANLSDHEARTALLRQTIADWQSGSIVSRPDAADRIALLNEMLRLFPPSLRDHDAQALIKALESAYGLEKCLRPPERGLAMADGTGLDEPVHIRGNARNPGPDVPRRLLEALGLDSNASSNQGSGRLELARRLLEPDNPLLARVLVNRLWKHHFGEGIVRSPDNFGVLGERPSHPELLDYLATEFIRRGCSIKALHRLLLLSSAYQMASTPSESIEVLDPGNRLLHRMPLRRLEAECIRDALLAIAGRLNPLMFGPSVPVHLTPHMAGRGRPEKSGPLDGAGRRSIYLAVRRNFLQPLFLAFDYPIPFTTIGRRGVSNVPAQALALLNNPLVVQMADAWARRILAEPGLSPADRIVRMYRAAFSRPPSADESAAALAFVEEESKTQGRNAAYPWINLAHVLFNVKEFVVVE